jgi:hypothetical protein
LVCVGRVLHGISCITHSPSFISPTYFVPLGNVYSPLPSSLEGTRESDSEMDEL